MIPAYVARRESIPPYTHPISSNALLCQFGFEERIHGDHHIFVKEGIVDIVNLQPKGAKAKPYQVKQVRGLILRYKLGGSSVD